MLPFRENRNDSSVIDEVSRNIEEVVDEVFSSNCNNALISSEYFPGVTRSEIENIYFSKLSSRVNVKIIAYLRRQDEYLESWFAQLVKTTKPDADIYNLMSELRRSKLLDHDHLLGKWAEFFGKGSILARPYERRQFKRENLLYDFLSIFGIEQFERFSFEEKDANVSLSRDQIVLIKAFYNAGLERFVDDVVRKPFDFDTSSSRYFLSPSEREALIEEFSASNEAVAREYLKREDGRLFCDPLPSVSDKGWTTAEHPAPEYLLRTFTHLLSKQRIHFSKEIEALRKDIENLKVK